jgi:hypothetical protein
MRSLALSATGIVLLAVMASPQTSPWSPSANATPARQDSQTLVIAEPANGSDAAAQVVTIRGSAPPGSEIGRKIGGKDPKFYAGEDGHWEYSTKLKEGQNNFDLFLQEDKDSRAKLTINWRPALTVDEPAQRAEVTERGVIVKGTAPPRAEIGLSIDGKDPKFYAGADGHWEYPVKVTKSGENTFKFFLQEAKVAKVELDLIWKPVLAVDEPTANSTVSTGYVAIKGSAPPGAEIGRDIKKANDPKFFAGPDGRWTHMAKLKEGENNLDFYLQGADDVRVRLTLNYVASGGGQSPAETPSGQPASQQPTETPTGPSTTFGEGTKQVNADIAPGTYRGNLDKDFCYWERLSGFSGEVDDIIANGNSTGSEIVTIAPTDVGFNSNDCGDWTQGLSPITSSQTDPFGEGTLAVGIDIAAGTWRAEGGDTCYWERMSSFGHTVDDIIANDAGTIGPIVTIAATDAGFSSSGCGTWTKQG